MGGVQTPPPGKGILRKENNTFTSGTWLQGAMGEAAPHVYSIFVLSSIWHEYVGIGACAAQKLKNSVFGSLDVAGSEWGTHRATMKGPPSPSPGVLMEGGCLGPRGGKRKKKIEMAGFFRRTPKNENGKPFSFF